VPFINDGEPVPVVEISTGLSLSVILGVLVVTIAASLLSPAGRAQNAIANARRHAASYLDSEYTADPAERERIFQLLLTERDQIVALGPKYRQKVRDEPALMALLDRARDSHDAAVTRGEAAPTGGAEDTGPRRVTQRAQLSLWPRGYLVDARRALAVHWGTLRPPLAADLPSGGSGDPGIPSSRS
jgi:tellurite resistance protein TerC